MFLDEAVIEITGGSGGRGSVSWRREKYIPMGGPDGGNGGRGGNVYFIADENTDTLSHFSSRKKFAAERGTYGSGQNKAGRNGEDIWLSVPPGTLINRIDETGNLDLIADLTHPGETVLAARGGRGGFGNAHFKSSVRQRPDFAELGEEGEKLAVRLELKLVADIGIVGYPSVGKSTLISVVSSAKPKIADYPFTTLVPNLGVVTVDDRSYVVCDVPGLIEGAHEGKGLGDTFLKHIERCGLLLHVLDVSRALLPGNEVDADVLVREYRAIRHELESYSQTLAAKTEYVLLNKIDLIPEIASQLPARLKERGIDVFAGISSSSRLGTEELKKKLLPVVLEKRAEQSEFVQEDREALPTLTPHLDTGKMASFTVSRDGDRIHIVGKRIEQFAEMTNFALAGAQKRFRDVCDRIGLRSALRRCDRTDDDKVLIGDIDVSEYL